MRGDIRDTEAIVSLFREGRFDAVVPLAALAIPQGLGDALLALEAHLIVLAPGHQVQLVPGPPQEVEIRFVLPKLGVGEAVVDVGWGIEPDTGVAVFVVVVLEEVVAERLGGGDVGVRSVVMIFEVRRLELRQMR